MNQPNRSSESSPNRTQGSTPPEDAAGVLKSNIAADAHELKEQAQHAATDVISHAKESAQTSINHGRERAADSLGNVANALRHTGEELRGKSESGLNEYVVRAADQVDSAAEYLQKHDLAAILGDVGDFARREPALFIGGAFALGVLGGRFLKSSASSQVSSSGRPPARGGEQTDLPGQADG